MDIAEVAHIFYPQSIGDPFNAYEYSTKLVAKGHNVIVITWNKLGSSLKGTNSNITIYRLPGINFAPIGIITDYPYIPMLPNVLREFDFDILHANSHLFLTTLSAIMAAKKLRKPTVVTVHGVMVRRSFNIDLLQKIYLYTAGSWVFKNSSRIICLTKSDAIEVMKYGCIPEKIRIIPNAVDTNLFRPNAGNGEGNWVIWVGRFVPEKGLKYLIATARMVCTEFDDVKFQLIGGGPLKPTIMGLVKKWGLAEKVFFRGVMSRKEVAKALAKSSIFIFPSLSEGLPMSLLEAMACAKPVIASNIPGIKDLIIHGQNGLLAPPKNPEAFAKAIVSILEDKVLKRKLGHNARSTIIKNHSDEVIISKIENVYREAIEEFN